MAQRSIMSRAVVQNGEHTQEAERHLHRYRADADWPTRYDLCPARIHISRSEIFQNGSWRIRSRGYAMPECVSVASILSRT